MSRGAISANENGKVKPKRTTLNLWALATGVPLEWLEIGEEVHPPGLEPGTHWLTVTPPKRGLLSSMADYRERAVAS